jgi:glutamyl endopeptidase
MMRTKIVIAATAGLALAGAVAATTSAAAGAATASAPPRSALVTAAGQVITPQAAASMSRIAGAQGRSAHQPTAPVRQTTVVQPHSVIGTDSRFQVTATTSFPNSAVVLIRKSGSLWCTGFMVGKDTLVSAGHCVTDGHGTWYSGLTFTPGSNGGTAPFGSCSSRGTYAFSAWASGADPNYDASIVKLNCTVGNSTGWFGTWWQSASPNGLFTRVQGYPGDKPSTQWESYDYVRSSSTDRLYYQNDTVGGESGSPIYQFRSSQPFCNGACVMGVHTNGSDGTNNSGTRFTEGKLNAIYAIVNQP